MTAPATTTHASTYLFRIPFPNGRNQVITERALEVVLRRKAPIAAGGGIIDILGPRVDDALALYVVLPGEIGAGKGADHFGAHFIRRRIERGEVVRGPR